MGNYWHTYCGSYNTDNYTRNNEPCNDYGMICNEQSNSCHTTIPPITTHDGSLSFPALTVTKKDIFKLEDGMSVQFNLGKNMYFDDNTGYNGMVSLCWYGCSMASSPFESLGIPEYVYSCCYDPHNSYYDPDDASSGSGLSSNLFSVTDPSCRGFVLTLFPDEGIAKTAEDIPIWGLNKNTGCVSAYKLFIMNQDRTFTVIHGYLPKTFDLRFDTTISVHNAFEVYHICIDGVEIASVPRPYNGRMAYLDNNCRFSMCVMPAADSGIDLNIKHFS